MRNLRSNHCIREGDGPMQAMEDVGSGMERGEYRGTTAWKTELETGVLLPQPRNTRTWKKKRKSPR